MSTDGLDRPMGPAAGPDLDAQIAAAERALVERDERVRRRVGTLGERLRHRGGIAVALAGGLLLLTRVMSSKRRAAGGASVASPSGLNAWGLLWPLLPKALHRAVPPGLASLFYLILPALAQWFSRRPGQGGKTFLASPVTSAESIDLQRYLGRWYEIARLPTTYQKRCVADVMAVYEKAGTDIGVVNSCRRSDGRVISRRGIARVVEASGNSRLRVSFAPRLLRALPAAWGDYWVLLVDNDYRHALVGTPDRRSLWLLSRAPWLGNEARQRLVDHARAQGYDTAQLISTLQLAGTDTRG